VAVSPTSSAPGPSDATHDMPTNVRAIMERHPEILKQLTDPEFINKLHQATVNAPDSDADWCVACGASATRAPGRIT
jgi:hypothetical protein